MQNTELPMDYVIIFFDQQETLLFENSPAATNGKLRVMTEMSRLCYLISKEVKHTGATLNKFILDF